MTVTVTVPDRTLKQVAMFARWTGNLLFLVGTAFLGWYVTSYFQARVYGAYEERQLAAAMSLFRHIDTSPPPPSRGNLVGQLDIPRIRLRAIVLEGTDNKVLRIAVGHIPGTALPGESGNVSLAAHRDSFFRPLRHLRKDDVIELTTFRGINKYRVDWMRVVSPDDVDVLRPSDHPTLTLVTCYPFYFLGSAPERFVVRAHQEE